MPLVSQSWLQRSRKLAHPARMNRRPRKTGGELLHENPWFAVRRRRGFYTIEHHLAQVVVLPLVDRRAVVMVRVKRPIVGDLTLELPAGGAERGEPPAQGAARELAEETGIRVSARRLVPMAQLAVMPNRTPDRVHVFRVNLSREEYLRRTAHDAEVAAVELVPITAVRRLLASGAIYLALPVAVLGLHLLTGRRPRRLPG
jgi:ADP-ribose pyrophosphatase